MKRRTYVGMAICVVCLVVWFVASTVLQSYFFNAVEHRDAETVAVLLNIAPGLVHRVDAYGDTALVLSVGHADHETAKSLIKAGSDLNFHGRRVGTPLHTAAYFGDTEMMRLLLDAGADLAAQPTHVSAHCRGTPLHEAASGGKADAVKLLIERGAEINAIDRLNGGTPLVKAVWAEPKSSTRALAVEYLLGAGADIGIVDSQGKTPLQLARGYVEQQSRTYHNSQRYPELLEVVQLLEDAERRKSNSTQREGR